MHHGGNEMENDASDDSEANDSFHLQRGPDQQGNAAVGTKIDMRQVRFTHCGGQGCGAAAPAPP